MLVNLLLFLPGLGHLKSITQIINQMADGTDFFDHFTVNANKEYINKSDTYTNPNIYKSREPRFYASVLYDSAIWQPRFPGLDQLDPLGIYDRRTRVVIENGKVVSERF